jgi:hypothetical protein
MEGREPELGSEESKRRFDEQLGDIQDYLAEHDVDI